MNRDFDPVTRLQGWYDKLINQPFDPKLRKVIQGLGWTLMVGASGLASDEMTKKALYHFLNHESEPYTVIHLDDGLPRSSHGLSLNMLDLYNVNPRSQDAHIQEALNLGANLLRLFVNLQDLQTDSQTGYSQQSVDMLAEKIKILAYRANKATRQANRSNLGFVISLYSGYDLGSWQNQPSLVYCPDPKYDQEIINPAANRTEQYATLFTDEKKTTLMKKRVKTLVWALRDIPNIVGWGFNEIEPPDHRMYDTTYNLWLKEMIDIVAATDDRHPPRPFFTGVSNPAVLMHDLMPAQAVFTIHAYGWPPLFEDGGTIPLPGQPLKHPMFVEECNVMRTIGLPCGVTVPALGTIYPKIDLNPVHDFSLSKYVKSIANRYLIVYDHSAGIAYVRGGFGLWHGRMDHHDDFDGLPIQTDPAARAEIQHLSHLYNA